MRSVLNSVFFIAFIFAAVGCGNNSAPKNRGAIVFGDSSTIVTETDPRYLSNNVNDIVLQKQEIKADTPILVQKVDTVAPVVKKEEAPLPTNTLGISAPFKSCSVFISDVKGRAGKNINWEKDKGASFTLEQGELNGKSLTVKGLTITKVMQRSQTVVLLKVPNGKAFKLASLPGSNSDWQTLKGKNGQYTIANIAKSQLTYNAKFTPKALRNATQKLAHNNKMSKKEEQKLMSSIRNVNKPTQAPCSLALQSVIWKISGKDATGKSIERELRIDINL